MRLSRLPMVGLITSAVVLSGCTAISNWADGVGDKMPTYGQRCENDYFCFGEASNQKKGAVYPPRDAYPNGARRPLNQGLLNAPQAESAPMMPVPSPYGAPPSASGAVPPAMPGYTPAMTQPSSVPGAPPKILNPQTGQYEEMQLDAEGHIIVDAAPQIGPNGLPMDPLLKDPRASALKPWEASPDWRYNEDLPPSPMEQMRDETGM